MKEILTEISKIAFFFSTLHSFYNLESRLIRNTELKVFLIYAEIGHMTPFDINKVKPIYFIPHLEVFKWDVSFHLQHRKANQNSVVYYASAKTTNGKSLNYELFIGPKLQNKIQCVK